MDIKYGNIKVSKLLLILITLLLGNCEMKESEGASSSKNINIEHKESKSNEFEFENFIIKKGQLGNILIKMTISEAESKFIGLTRKIDKDYNWGFDGGGKAFVYYLNDEQVFTLLSALESDTIIAIIAIHKKLNTINGLNPKSSVKELLQVYPNLTFSQDFMNGCEVAEDASNNWVFNFYTKEHNQIGQYPKIDSISKPVRLNTKMDWITIN